MSKKRRESRFIGTPDEFIVFSSPQEAKEFARKRKAEIEARIQARKQKSRVENSTLEVQTSHSSNDETTQVAKDK